MEGEAVHVLVFMARGRACALRLADLIETMRPQPVNSIPGVPAHLLGLALIRGEPVPVVDLGALMGLAEAVLSTRFLTLHVGSRTVAVAVDRVLGTRSIDAGRLNALPSLMQNAQTAAIESLGAVDRQLFTVLSAGRLLSEDDWRRVEQSAGAAAVTA